MTMKKRLLACLLTAAMLVSLFPLPVLAAEAEPYTGGLCPHHQEHTEDCGYIKAVEGQPCGHVHDGDRGFVEAAEEIPCDMDCAETDEDSQIIHGEECGYVPEVEGVPCQHEHDGGCGYVPADPGQPCGYVCRICPVQALIDALPDGEDITPDNRAEAEAQLEAIDTAWAELSDEEALRLDTVRLETARDALCLASTLLSPAYEFSPLPGRSQTHTVDGGYELTEEKLRNLINSDAVQDGDTIILNGSCMVNDIYSDAAPWCITKSVTIQGGSLQLRAGGIVLGADVTFQDIELSFENSVRNAIIANGYTLTLNNVSRNSGARQVHALCGSVTGIESIPQPGLHGKIVVNGTTTVGNLYAGSLSGGLGLDNEFTGSAEIVVNTDINHKIENIYACGAMETYIPDDSWFDQKEPAPPRPFP